MYVPIAANLLTRLSGTLTCGTTLEMQLRRYFHDYRTSGLRKRASAVEQKQKNHDDGHVIAIVAPPHPPLTLTTVRKPSDTSTSPYAAIYLPSEWPPPSLYFAPSLCRPRAFAIIELPYH